MSLLASGVMPARSEGGTIMLVLCTGDGMVEVAADPVTLQPLEKHSGSKGDRCAWACAQAPVLLADIGAPPGFAGRVMAAEQPRVATRLAILRATGLPPSTGPPAVL